MGVSVAHSGMALQSRNAPVWVTLGLVPVWVVVAISNTGQAPYDYLAGVRVERVSLIAQWATRG